MRKIINDPNNFVDDVGQLLLELEGAVASSRQMR
jgi:hypothetical protein